MIQKSETPQTPTWGLSTEPAPEPRLQSVISRMRELADRFQTAIVQSDLCAQRILSRYEPECEEKGDVKALSPASIIDELWDVIHTMERQAADMERHARHLKEIA